jgi:hypothetical protein
VVALAPSASANTDCGPGFERWVKFSDSRLRLQRTTSIRVGGGQQPREEACVPSERTRQELLSALVRTRMQCEVSSEPTAQHTRRMIDINETVTASLPLCRLEEGPPPAGWVTGTIAAPKPPAPPPAAQAAPKQTVPTARQCLELSSAPQERFVLANKRCGGQTVLAIVERRGPSGETECKGYMINDKLTLAARVRPQVHYECSMTQQNCTREHMAAMFPECD